MLKDALHYLSLNWSVIPLRPNSKEPLIKWTEFQKRRATEKEVLSWFQEWPNANVGVVTGSVSGIAVIDLDGLEGYISGQSLGLVSSAVSLTGNGRQLWYRNLERLQNSVKMIARGVDVRAEGGYVVAPPSTHPNGRQYRWLSPVSGLSASSVTALPPFPRHLIVKDAVSNISGANAPSAVKNEKGWIAEALEGMTNGNIDNTLFRVCSRLRNDGYSEQDAICLLSPFAEKAGATPGHLEDKIRNVWGRYEPKHMSNNQRPITPTQLVLHSPTNPDSLDEFRKRTSGVGGAESLATGYVAFDTLTKGLKKGEVCVIGARTGVGKSNFIIGPIRTFCQSRKRVLLASTEMSFDQVWSRYIATLPSSEDFKTHQFYVLDDFTPDIERIEEALKQVMPDLLCFDHINNVGTDYHFLSKFMSGLKELARKFNIPVIVTAQLNRSADYIENGERQEPRLSMLQGSDQIGQMAALVLLLHEKRVVNDCTEIDGLVVKNRHGDRGLIQFGLFKSPFYHIREL